LNTHSRSRRKRASGSAWVGKYEPRRRSELSDADIGPVCQPQ
jgi:hypothetical protein